MKKIKTLDIEIGIMDYFGIRKNLIVPNVSWGIQYNNKYLHECDILVLTNSGYATEIEIKISRTDLLKDCKKFHGHKHDLITNLFFAVPEVLKEIALDIIPERAGLLIVKWETNKWGTHFRVSEIKPCVKNTNGVKWDLELKLKLARLGTMRINGLKKKVQELESRKIKNDE